MTLEPLAAARERTIDALSRHFAEDHISLEELERRLESAYRAGTGSELARLTEDLPALGTPAPAPVPARRDERAGRVGRSGLPPDTQRLLAIMSAHRRAGLWTPPRSLEVVAVMSETVIDLSESPIPPMMEIKLFAMMAAVRIVVPEGTQVMDEMLAIMANVRNDALLHREDRGAPVVRIHGSAFMAEVVVQVAPRRA